MSKNVLEQFNLANKKAIVTGVGAMQGIGCSIAEGLCEAGCEVVLINRSDRVFEILEAFQKKGFRAHAFTADLSDRDQLRDAFDKAIGLLGGDIDILVNCAGVQRRMPSLEFTEEAWDTVIDLNLHSVFFLSQLAAREMAKKGSGKIINIASMLSYFGGYMVPAYTASKSAVAGLTKALTNEWIAKGINVNAIAPGYIATDMARPLMEDPIRNKEILDRIPAGAWGNPDDMKGLAVFLASDASRYVSGAIIPMDGGFLCR